MEVSFRKASIIIFSMFTALLVLVWLKLFYGGFCSTLLCKLALTVSFGVVFFVSGLLIDFIYLFYFKNRLNFRHWVKIDWRIFSDEETTQNLEYAAKILKQNNFPFVAIEGLFICRLYVPREQGIKINDLIELNKHNIRW